MLKECKLVFVCGCEPFSACDAARLSQHVTKGSQSSVLFFITFDHNVCKLCH